MIIGKKWPDDSADTLGVKNLTLFLKYLRVFMWVENFDEIALSHTVKEIQAVLCFTR